MLNTIFMLGDDSKIPRDMETITVFSLYESPV